jgi:arsenite-transporting ATPase
LFVPWDPTTAEAMMPRKAARDDCCKPGSGCCRGNRMTATVPSSGTFDDLASSLTSPLADSLEQWAATATRHLFFTGKGGVGKTTVASAMALRIADQGRHTLIVSTDPASNLDDVFGLRAGPVPTPVPGVAALWLMNIDPVAAAAAYRARLIAPYRDRLPQAAVRSMEEQLSGACTVEIAAFNEFTGLLGDPAVAGHFDHILFDTAPTGHTLRLLSLPTAWTSFIEANRSGTSCLGPLAGLERQRAQYSAAVATLADSDLTTLILVTRPDASSLREAERAGAELRTLGLRNQRLVVNGVLDAPAVESDRVSSVYASRQRHAMTAMPPALGSLRRLTLPLFTSELTGLDALRLVSQRQSKRAESITHAADRPPPPTLPGFDDLVASLASNGRGVILTMGKGGVGKTTLAVRIALALARSGQHVHLSTTDPAAHVEAALADLVEDTFPETLSVDRIDPVAETQRYTSEVLSAAGDLDPDERSLMEEDLRSPCTEEIAVFRAFARTVDRAKRGFVVLDTAPTGHTLLLLDAAESYHREVARTAGAQVPDEVRALLPRLRDPEYAKMLLVTLPEATPVLEAKRLQEDLRRAGIEPFGWIVNASLAAAGTRHAVLASRARLELPHVRRISDELATRTWLIPWVPNGDSAMERVAAEL